MPRKKKQDTEAESSIAEQQDEQASRPKRKTRKTKKTVNYVDDDIETEEPAAKKKKTKRGKKKEDEYVPSGSDDEEETIDVESEDESEPVEKKKKKTSKKVPKEPKTPKTPTKKKESTKKATPKKTTSKKKSKDTRHLTHYITSENFVDVTTCSQRIPNIVNTKKIDMTSIVNFPPQSTRFTKNILFNTEPQKERKGYTENESNQRECVTVELDLHNSKLLGLDSNSTAAVLNIGAPIWALDWVSRPESNQDQYAAISPHTLHSPFHKAGKATSRDELFKASPIVSVPTISDYEHCGKIQIWNMGTLSDTLDRAPQLEFYIEHEHGFVWDLQWMPNSYIHNERLGILACACSDGAILVLNVPHYTKILADYERRHNTKLNKGENIVLSLHPEVYTQSQHDSENNSTRKIPYTISWSPNLKFFVSGYHDGTISLWKINDSNDRNLLEHAVTTFGHSHPTNDLSIRSITWFDPSMNENIFATCSNDGFFKIWDIRDIFYPYYSSLSGNRFWITGVVFPEKSNALISVSHDGTVRQFDAIENAFQLVSSTDGPIWDVTMCASRSSILVCTATGRVEVMSLEQDSMGKKRRAVDSRVDDLLLQVEIVTNHKDYSDNLDQIYKLFPSGQTCYSLPYNFQNPSPNSSIEKYNRLPIKSEKEKLIPDTRIAMHRTLYHPSKDENLKSWCLLGGFDGLTFLLKIPDVYTSQ